MKTMTSTRDNFIAHAIRTGECPSCNRPLDVKTDPVVCKCGFRFGRAEANL